MGMIDPENERMIDYILREHGLVLEPEDRRALIDLYPVFREMAQRLRTPATAEISAPFVRPR
jgi:hypothetical protein